MSGIIYKVTNLINNKIYIGQTVKLLKYRQSEHISSALRNLDNNYFHNAIRCYGIENFEWVVIWKGDRELLDSMEINYIKKYNSYKYNSNSNGYNLTVGGGTTTGFKYSNDMKKACSIRTKGKNNPRYDKTVYIFKHPKYGIEELTKYDFYKKHNLDPSGVTAIIKKRQKSLKGWIIWS